jgi:hypothetical protein
MKEVLTYISKEIDKEMGAQKPMPRNLHFSIHISGIEPSRAHNTITREERFRRQREFDD